MNLNPNELRAYVLGLSQAIIIAKRYVGIDMVNYIGELENAIDQAESLPGYKEWLNKFTTCEHSGVKFNKAGKLTDII